MNSFLFSIFSVIVLVSSQVVNVPPHPEVLRNALYESQLPPHLVNMFYRNPQIRSALARMSWFGPGERQVFDREADKVPRKDIFNVLKHAGLLPQQLV